MDRGTPTSAPAADGSDALPVIGGPSTSTVAPKAPAHPVGRLRIDRYRRLPEVYIESHALARAIAAISVVAILAGSWVWLDAVSARFDQPDVIRPAWYRYGQWALGAAGIAAAMVQVAYAACFAITGRVWRRWRGVSITFLALTSAWTGLWLVDRFLLDYVFG